MQIVNSRYRFTISWHWMLIYPKYWTATRDVIGLYPLSIRVQTQGWPHGKLGARCWKWCYIISYLASGKLINTKIVLGDCKCLNWKKFRISCHLVSSLQDARSLENINCAIILLWGIVLQLKNSQFKLWLRMWRDLVRALVMFMVWPCLEDLKEAYSWRIKSQGHPTRI